jgi:1-aminocyclopropane-1-carboxylate deaminase
MQDINFDLITTDQLSLALLDEKKVSLSVLRLDKIHPSISGNKFFKLRYYFDEAKHLGKTKIITFGGAWSNHIAATAAASKLYEFQSTGYIRGEEPKTLSQTLKTAKELGMQLIFCSRDEYVSIKRNFTEENKNEYVINEGGYGSNGAAGAATILSYCRKEIYSHFVCATGTGTMLAGLVMSSLASQQITGISVLKNNLDVSDEINALLNETNQRFSILHDYHFGGYAKHKPELISFMNTFYEQTSIPTDFVYTGKLFFGIVNCIANDFFSPGSNLLAIHSGGLQGNSSLNNGTLIF